MFKNRLSVKVHHGFFLLFPPPSFYNEPNPPFFFFPSNPSSCVQLVGLSFFSCCTAIGFPRSLFFFFPFPINNCQTVRPMGEASSCDVNRFSRNIVYWRHVFHEGASRGCLRNVCPPHTHTFQHTRVPVSLFYCAALQKYTA